jgi:[ribosomal protein S18]-alanine N-acetyltransferase
MSVEQITAAHAEALAVIHRQVFPPGEAWSDDAFALQLAFVGVFGLIDRRGGLLLARVTVDEAEVLTLGVLPEARRQGVACALLGEAEAIARSRGAIGLFLEVAPGNTAARALYARAGFIEIARRRRYYADGSDALVMRKDFAA